MKQIEINKFNEIVAKLKNNDDFKDFIKGVQQSLDDFCTTGKLSYKENKNELTYDFSDKNHPIKKYIHCIKNIEKIFYCTPAKMIRIKKEIDCINLSLTKVQKKAFYDKIKQILNYKELRSGDKKLLFYYYKLLGPKACVYCNSQHIILLNKSKIARLQADHNIPQDKYPCFSISLANLYPTCNNCNHLKFNKEIKYNLFLNNGKLQNNLKFKLSESSIASFMNSNLNDDLLEIEFDQTTTKLNDVLCITEIYENHKDYIADLITKKKIYNNAYLNILNNKFANLFGHSPEVFNRMLYGSTLDEKDVNSRVFSRLLIDIKKQLDELDF